MNLWKLHILDLAWSYFRESKAYDLKRGIDTHRRVPLSAYGMVGADLAGANLYMAAWTSVIRDSFMELLHCRDGGLEDFDCIDAGRGRCCSYGKSCSGSRGLGMPFLALNSAAPFLMYAGRIWIGWHVRMCSCSAQMSLMWIIPLSAESCWCTCITRLVAR